MSVSYPVVLAENGQVERVPDLLDGSFQLQSKPQALRSLRVISIVLAVVDVATVFVLVVLAAILRQPGLLVPAAAFLLFVGIMQVAFRRLLKPPVLKADSMTVTYTSVFKFVVVPLAELKMIFQGQVMERARHTAWVRSYIFATDTGKVMFSVPAGWLGPEDVAVFAERLRVPVRGDFTERVTGTSLHEPDSK